MPRAVDLRRLRVRPRQIFVKSVHDEEIGTESAAGENEISRIGIDQPYRSVQLIGGRHRTHGGNHHDDHRDRIEGVPAGKLVLRHDVRRGGTGHQGEKSGPYRHEYAVEIHHRQRNPVGGQRKAVHPILNRPHFGQAVDIEKKVPPGFERVHQAPQKGKKRDMHKGQK